MPAPHSSLPPPTMSLFLQTWSLHSCELPQLPLSWTPCCARVPCSSSHYSLGLECPSSFLYQVKHSSSSYISSLTSWPPHVLFSTAELGLPWALVVSYQVLVYSYFPSRTWALHLWGEPSHWVQRSLALAHDLAYKAGLNTVFVEWTAHSLLWEGVLWNEVAFSRVKEHQQSFQETHMVPEFFF